MSSILEHIVSIEGKMNLLLGKLRSQQKENDRLRRELEERNREWEEQKKKIEQLMLQLEISGSAMDEASKANKTILEKRINEYIREIDRCIALLGDQD